MERLALYLRDFNREYLSTREDRRHVREALLSLPLLAGILLAVAIVLGVLD